MLEIEGGRLEIITQVLHKKSSPKSPQNGAQNVGNGENGRNFVFGVKSLFTGDILLFAIAT